MPEDGFFPQKIEFNRDYSIAVGKEDAERVLTDCQERCCVATGDALWRSTASHIVRGRPNGACSDWQQQRIPHSTPFSLPRFPENPDFSATVSFNPGFPVTRIAVVRIYQRRHCFEYFAGGGHAISGACSIPALSSLLNVTVHGVEDLAAAKTRLLEAGKVREFPKVDWSKPSNRLGPGLSIARQIHPIFAITHPPHGTLRV